MLEGKLHPADDGAIECTENDERVRVLATIRMLELVGSSRATLVDRGPRLFK